jgi:hypothetical protein
VGEVSNDELAAARMRKSALTAVVDGKIWTLDRPVWFGGVRLRPHSVAGRNHAAVSDPPGLTR